MPESISAPTASSPAAISPSPPNAPLRRRSSYRNGGASTATSARSAIASPPRGFLALAPDLYRGKTTTQPSEAEQTMMALSMDRAEKDMRGAVAYLMAHETFNGRGVGALGYRLGGGLAVRATATSAHMRAAVTYYYAMPHGKPNLSAIQAAVLGHFGTRARNRAARRRCPRPPRVLPRRRTRVLQRHGQARNLRRAGRAALVGQHDRVPASGTWAASACYLRSYKMLRDGVANRRSEQERSWRMTQRDLAGRAGRPSQPRASSAASGACRPSPLNGLPS
jgi:hypothetical protein